MDLKNPPKLPDAREPHAIDLSRSFLQVLCSTPTDGGRGQILEVPSAKVKKTANRSVMTNLWSDPSPDRKTESVEAPFAINASNSYGVIMFCMDGNTIKYLVYRQRDTYEYGDILRGNWTSMRRLEHLLRSISSEEFDRLRNHSFDELWDDFWVEGTGILGGTCGRRHRWYHRAKRIFISLPWNFLFAKTESSNIRKKPDWGFPKGKRINDAIPRDDACKYLIKACPDCEKEMPPSPFDIESCLRRNRKEGCIDCALREFVEETGVALPRPTGRLAEVWRFGPLYEYFFGDDGIGYRSFYYIVQIHELVEGKRMQTPRNIRKSTLTPEAETIEWVTLEQAKLVLHPRRLDLLHQADSVIRLHSVPSASTSIQDLA